MRARTHACTHTAVNLKRCSACLCVLQYCAVADREWFIGITVTAERSNLNETPLGIVQCHTTFIAMPNGMSAVTHTHATQLQHKFINVLKTQTCSIRWIWISVTWKWLLVVKNVNINKNVWVLPDCCTHTASSEKSTVGSWGLPSPEPS